MSIKEFYSQLSNKSLNISLYFLCIGVLTTVIVILNNSWVVIGIIFILISILYYSLHLYYVKRAKVEIPINNEYEDYRGNRFLIESTDYHIYFFSPKGTVLDEVKIRSRLTSTQYILISNGQEIGHAELNIIGRPVLKIYGRYKWECHLQSRLGRIGELRDGNGTKINVLKNKNGDWIIEKNEKLLASIKKGWLERNWINLFRLNTPVLFFYEKINEAERTALLFFISAFYEK